MSEKFRLRKEILANRDKFDEYKYFEKNNIIYKRVSELLEMLRDQVLGEMDVTKLDHKYSHLDDKLGLGIYFPLKTEPDIFKISITADWNIALPKVRNAEMEYVRYQAGGKLIKSSFGDLYEPSSNSVITPKVVLVPGVAFDVRGYRLGYGIGHFDRYFAQKKNADIIKIGVCYDETLLEFLPCDVHDIKMDYIITETNRYIL